MKCDKKINKISNEINNKICVDNGKKLLDTLVSVDILGNDSCGQDR